MTYRVDPRKHQMEPASGETAFYRAPAESERPKFIESHHAVLLRGDLSHDQVTWQILGSVTGPEICQFAQLGL